MEIISSCLPWVQKWGRKCHPCPVIFCHRFGSQALPHLPLILSFEWEAFLWETWILKKPRDRGPPSAMDVKALLLGIGKHRGNGGSKDT